MTGKKKPAGKDVAPKNPSDLSLSVRDGVDGVKEGMTQSELMATVIARSVTSAPTLKLYSACGDGLEVQDLVNELRNAGDEVVKGDLARMERMLVKQAMTLDAIFNNLAQKSHRQEYMKQMETYLRLALKAQSQSRATAEALALMKNPMPYIRQANISGGAQQVNNGPQGHAQAQQTMIAETSSFAPNKLLEGDSHARMDI
ncbi:MAG: hypothetical protein H7245_08565 [Candidatus Saccharibacteria bacterium]|nr:hypothetical protein [Pseudorhodobacter sp.]